MITASIVVDLTPADELPEFSRRKFYEAEIDSAPDGARVIVLVGSRALVDPVAVRILAAASRRLHIDIRADNTQTAQRWCRAVLSGGFGEVA